MSDNKLSKEASSSSKSGDRKGNSGGEVTESERVLAQGALADFNKNNFTVAASAIVKLQSLRPKDVKVLSNKAVVDYYLSGLRKTEALQKSLSEICSQAGIKFDDIKSSDEVEASVIRLNRCTILFHLQQLQSAKAYLESMYNGLESLEESVSIGLCLLLAEVLLEMSLPGRALSVVAHTEATFLPQPLPPQTSSTKQLHTDKDSRSPEKSSGKENMSISHSNSASGNSYNRTNIMNSHASNDPISGSSEMRCSADQELLRGRLQLLRVRSLLQMKILRVAKKELKAFVNHAISSGNPLNVTLIMLKSQLEYLKGSCKKSVKVLNQCSAITAPPATYSPSLGTAYYNNLGIVHVGMQKPTVACLYFQKALQELKNTTAKDFTKPDDSPLTVNLYCNPNPSGLRLCLNLGLTLMHLGKPSPAFDFLLQTVKAHPDNPRLWLRMAECCVAVHKMNIQADPEQQRHHTIVLRDSVRKVPILSNSHDKKLCDQQVSQESAIPVPTLEFARICLRNCLTLIPDDVSAAFLTEEQEASGVLPDLHPCAPSSPMKGAQTLSMKLRCLACSAYVSLCLGDSALALRNAQTLLQLVPKLPQVDPALRLLGHLYAGESLILQGRVPDAVSHLDPKQVGDVPLECQPVRPTADKPFVDTTAWSLLNSSVASKLMQYNLGLSYALHGRFGKANCVLKKVLGAGTDNIPTQVIMLSLFVNLQLGASNSLYPVIERGLTPSST